MTERVLVPVDGSDPSVRALDHALEQFPDAELVLLHVVDPFDVVFSAETGGPLAGEAWYEAERESAAALLDELSARAAPGRAVETAILVGKPARAIAEYVDDHEVDHVVVGSHGRSGTARLVLGSVAEAVLRRVDRPVTVIR